MTELTKWYFRACDTNSKSVTRISNFLPSRQYSKPTLIYSIRAHRGRIRGFRCRKFSSKKCTNIVELPSSPCHQKLCRQHRSCFNRCLWQIIGFQFENSDFRFKINNFERKWFEFIFIWIYFNLFALLTKLTLKGVQGLSSPENVSSIELISLELSLKFQIQKIKKFLERFLEWLNQIF